jgi:hypothetical protein
MSKTATTTTNAAGATQPARNFTITDCQPWAGHLGLFADRSELIERLLPWQRYGLSYTATGYGAKIPHAYCIRFEGRTYRLYVTQFGNAGSVWFTSKGRTIFVN